MDVTPKKPRTKRWSVYLLRCADGSLYAGIALDLAARIAVHNAGKGAKYTKPRLPVALAWSKRLPATKARILEYRLKRLTKSQKESLVSSAVIASAAKQSPVHVIPATRSDRSIGQAGIQKKGTLAHKKKKRGA